MPETSGIRNVDRAAADNPLEMAKKTTRRAVSVELIVKRGAHGRFKKLKDKATDLPVTVSWDRRQGDRRTAANGSHPDRRRTDRRRQPPFTWEVSDFVVVERARPRKRS